MCSVSIAHRHHAVAVGWRGLNAALGMELVRRVAERWGRRVRRTAGRTAARRTHRRATNTVDGSRSSATIGIHGVATSVQLLLLDAAAHCVHHRNARGKRIALLQLACWTSLYRFTNPRLDRLRLRRSVTRKRQEAGG